MIDILSRLVIPREIHIDNESMYLTKIKQAQGL